MKSNLYVPNVYKNNSIQEKSAKLYNPSLLKGTSRRTLNQYYSFNGENYNQNNELELITDLQDELIRIYGLKATYILRESPTHDKIYGESIGSVFKQCIVDIPVLPTEGFEEYMNGDDQIQPYGFLMHDTVLLGVSYKLICEEITKLGIKDRYCPMVGDLVFLNAPGVIFVINYLDDKHPLLIKSRITMYTMTCQTYMKSNSDVFDTGIPDIDVLNSYSEHYEYPNSDNEDINTEVKDYVLKEPNIWNLDFTKNFDYNK